jgi:hypothetical protein
LEDAKQKAGGSGMIEWTLRFYLDAESGQPHIYEHGVTEEEVRQVLTRPGEEFAGRKNTRIALGQTDSGRYLQVVYVPDDDRSGAFVITAYELAGRALKAYRRRRRRKRR